jgi:hypothetical protein
MKYVQARALVISAALLSGIPAIQNIRVPDWGTSRQIAGLLTTGSFTLDVYGGKPDFQRNIEAGKRAGKAIQRAIVEQQSEKASELNCCLTTNGSQAANLEAI